MWGSVPLAFQILGDSEVSTASRKAVSCIALRDGSEDEE